MTDAISSQSGRTGEGSVPAAVPAAQRIVCLSTETTETLYLLGAEHRIVGISGFTVRPPRARKEKPKVSAFTGAKIDRILALKPDLVVGFSNLQADIAAQLVKSGLEVHIFNQRSVAGILSMIMTLGALVGTPDRAAMLVAQLQDGMDRVRERASCLPARPQIYFEEWDEPMICGIGWVSELIGIAGGEDCFAELARQPLARDRRINDPDEVLRRRPDIIIGSWCGKKFRPERVCQRPGWEAIPAVRSGQVHEIASADILQPGPGALSDGLAKLHAIIAGWAAMAAHE